MDSISALSKGYISTALRPNRFCVGQHGSGRFTNRADSRAFWENLLRSRIVIWLAKKKKSDWRRDGNGIFILL